MRFDKLNPKGVKPPRNTLYPDRWSHCEPSTKDSASFIVNSGDGTENVIHVRGRTEQFLKTVLRQPVSSGSRCRISQYKAALKELGVVIECEGFHSDNQDGGTFGIYLLRSKVIPAPDQPEGA